MTTNLRTAKLSKFSLFYSAMTPTLELVLSLKYAKPFNVFCGLCEFNPGWGICRAALADDFGLGCGEAPLYRGHRPVRSNRNYLFHRLFQPIAPEYLFAFVLDSRFIHPSPTTPIPGSSPTFPIRFTNWIKCQQRPAP